MKIEEKKSKKKKKKRFYLFGTLYGGHEKFRITIVFLVLKKMVNSSFWENMFPKKKVKKGKRCNDFV